MFKNVKFMRDLRFGDPGKDTQDGFRIAKKSQPRTKLRNSQRGNVRVADIGLAGRKRRGSKKKRGRKKCKCG